MASIIAISMLTLASGTSHQYGLYEDSVYIGTPCECNATLISHAHVYDLSKVPPDANTSMCKAESVNPLDVWNGLGVGYYGYMTESWLEDEGDVGRWDPNLSGKWGTVEYQIDCEHLCLIEKVEYAGTGWCLKSGGSSQVVLKEECCVAKNLIFEWNAYIPDIDYAPEQSKTYLDVDIDNESAGRAGSFSYWAKSFKIYEWGSKCKEVPPEDIHGKNIDEWRCRNSLSIVATKDENVAGVSSILARKPKVDTSETTSGDTSDDSSDDSSNDSSDQQTQCQNDEECEDGQVCAMFECVDSSDDSSADSSDQPTHCHSDEECEDGQVCADLECVESSDSSSSESSDDSSADTSEQSTHCHHDDECEDGQVCDVFECVESSGDSNEESGGDSSEESGGDSSDESSADSSTDSSVDSSDLSSHCHSDEECEDDQICDGFECVDSSEDSSDDSSGNSGDDSSDSSGDDSSDDSSDESGLVGCEALPIDDVLSKCSANIACEARVQELEALQVTFRAMTSAKQVQSGKDDAAPLSSSSTSTFGVEEVLIVCLVLMNVALLSYVCLRKSNVAKNNSAYGDVRSSEQEDLCA